MLEAPRQDWAAYARHCRASYRDWLRGLSPAAALDLFEDFHRFVRSLESDRDADVRARREQSRWREKLALRSKLHAAFTAMDRLHDGRRDSQNAH